MKKILYSFVTMLLLSVMLCSAGFAVDLPDGVTHDPEMSGMAMQMLLEQFEAAKAELIRMSEEATPDQKLMYDELIAKLEEDKIQKVESINIYFTDEENPGEAYARLRAFYETELSGIRDIDPEEALNELPSGVGFSPEMEGELDRLIAAKRVKAAYGRSGKSRVSISTVYPDPLNDYALRERTVLVIATEK